MCIKRLPFTVILFAPLDYQTDRPTLIDCIRFRGKERRINIPQEIGVKYREFGLFLLEDHNGARIRSIAHKHNNDADQINTEVLEEWVAGKGRHPITWKTLIEVLNDIELSTLAEDIEAVKCHEDNISICDGHVQREQIITEGSEQRSTGDIPTAGMDYKYCETLEQRVDVAEDNQNNQMTSVPHGTGSTGTRSLLYAFTLLCSLFTTVVLLLYLLVYRHSYS